MTVSWNFFFPFLFFFFYYFSIKKTSCYSRDCYRRWMSPLWTPDFQRGNCRNKRRRRWKTEMWFYVVEEVFNSGWGWVRMGEAVQGYLCGTLHQENKCPFVLSTVCLLRFIFPVSCNCRQRLELREQFFDIFKFVCVATELRRRSVHDNKTQKSNN